MKNLSELQQDMYQEQQLTNRIHTLEKRRGQLEGAGQGKRRGRCGKAAGQKSFGTVS